MNVTDILTLRLHNTGLSDAPFKSAAEAVASLGAVQAQDFAAAKWALGLRVKNSTDETIERAFNEGAIIRTHVMRPTLHFVTPEDIRWMLGLTAPRVKSYLEKNNRKLGLNEAVFAKSNAAVVNALHDHKYLTRQELKSVVAATGIEADVQRFGHLIARAELDGLICSGPRRGKQFTYALLEERVGRSTAPGREKELARLALRYFTSHGPAQLKDFSWWSGLGNKDAGFALGLIESQLEQATHDGRTYWFSPRERVKTPDLPSALLLSVYDEYTIAYRDRGDISGAREIERMISMGNAQTAVIILNGRVAGTWSKRRKKNSVWIRLDPFRILDPDEQNALETEVERYGLFFGTSAVLVDKF